MPNAKTMVYRYGSAIDAASYVGTSWYTPSRWKSTNALYDVYWVVATAASLTLHVTTTALATTKYSVPLKGGSTTINTLHTDSFVMPGSHFFNLQAGVTTTLNYFIMVERTQW